MEQFNLSLRWFLYSCFIFIVYICTLEIVIPSCVIIWGNFIGVLGKFVKVAGVEMAIDSGDGGGLQTLLSQPLMSMSVI